MSASTTKHSTYNTVSGRVPGFWLAVASVFFAALAPFAALIVAVLGLSFSGRALTNIPAGDRARRLPLAGIALSGFAILAVIVSDIIAFLPF